MARPTVGAPSELPTESSPKQLSKRALQTRRRLIDAARSVFEEVGFTEARIVDIAERAGAALGSFYTYFTSKEEIFRAAIDETLDEINDFIFRRPQDDEVDDDWVARIDRANRRYFDAWVAHRRMLLTLEEIAGFNTEFSERSIALRRQFIDNYAETLEYLQASGEADPDLDPRHAAAALVSMVEQSCRWWVGRGEPYDPETALRTLTTLWARGIGLERAGASQPKSKRATARGRK